MRISLTTSRLGLALTVALATSGCATGMKWNSDLEQAKQLFEMVSEQSDVQLFAAAELEVARHQLQKAADAASYFNAGNAVSHEAEIARTRILIAEQRARASRARESLHQVQAWNRQQAQQPTYAAAIPQPDSSATISTSPASASIDSPGTRAQVTFTTAMADPHLVDDSQLAQASSAEPRIGAAMPASLKASQQDSLQALRDRVEQLEQMLQTRSQSTNRSMLLQNGEQEMQRELAHALHSMNAHATGQGMTIVLGDRYFLHQSARLAPRRADRHLDRIAALMIEHPSLTVKMQGHTDDQGDPIELLNHSTDKAVAIKNALVQRGIATQRIEASGYGSERPVAANDGDLGRLRNRRVDIIFPQTAIALR